MFESQYFIARYLPLSILILILLTGCGLIFSSDPVPVERPPQLPFVEGNLVYETYAIDVDGVQREFILYIPESYAAGGPMLLNFHGYGGTSLSQLEYADFRPIADEVGLLLVYPQGEKLGNTTHWNVGGWTRRSSSDDLGFINALIDEMATNYEIDRDRVYATGHSLGGYMSFLLACQLSDRIAAVASVSGTMTPDAFSDCNPQHPTPVLQIHGTADETIPYEQAYWTTGVSELLDYWVTFNGLSAEPSETPVPASPDTTADSSMDHFIYGDPAAGITVEHIRVNNGGHDWPNIRDGNGNVNLDLSINTFIWAFFARYDINGRIE